MITKLIPILLLLLQPLVGIELDDPSIPNGEKSVYRMKEGSTDTELINTVHHTNENGRDVYEFKTTTSTGEETKVKAIKNNLSVYWIKIRHSRAGSTVERETRLVESKSNPAEDELYVLDYNCLSYTLRGFPFTNKDKIKIKIIGTKNPFPLNVEKEKEETLVLDGKKFECYKLGLGMGSLFGKLFPKSFMWFSKNPPHFLVRSESSSGPGQSKITTELKSYAIIRPKIDSE